jgi:hypothetical protein
VRVNWFALAAGGVTLLVLALSLFMPWWRLVVGENLLTINASPVNTNFGLFGSPFRIPLLTALNIISLLTLAASAIAMLVYAFNPGKAWAKTLLGFAYRKPLYVLVSFILGLFIIVLMAGILGVEIPLTGSSMLTLPSDFTAGATITAMVVSGFELPFWIAIVAAVLCILARLYHRTL